MSGSGTWEERRAFWRELCAEFGASGSGVTQKAFAAERGVNVKRFRKGSADSPEGATHGSPGCLTPG